ncbi:MAG: helix-turn-helix transcriptional regulator [Betaproteobacteria bacterium]|nr:helix-turn-helix transcriptional regulator [Betaproteobacteria bacterium]
MSAGRRAIALRDSRPPSLHIVQPAAALRRYVDHYWIALSNQEETHTVLPDGTVDLVLSSKQMDCRAELFGTTTTRVDVPLVLGSHYLGICFRAGQSRHFFRRDATELTDSCVPVEVLDMQSVDELATAVAQVDVHARLDAWLMRTLERRPPHHSVIDVAIQRIEFAGGNVCMGSLAGDYGKSLRQFERRFLETVGVSPKLFAQIVRFQQSLALLSTSTLPLAQLAAELGYADQSHLSHAFSRFYGSPPSQARGHVAFLQDT